MRVGSFITVLIKVSVRSKWICTHSKAVASSKFSSDDRPFGLRWRRAFAVERSGQG
jgi:hypothetical protein